MDKLDRERVRREYNILLEIEREEREKEENRIIDIPFAKKQWEDLIRILRFSDFGYKVGINPKIFIDKINYQLGLNK